MNTTPRRPGALTRQAVQELVRRGLAPLDPWDEPDALLRLLSPRGLVVHLPDRDLRGPAAVRAWANEFVRTRELRCQPVGAPRITLTSPVHADVVLDVRWTLAPRGERARTTTDSAQVELSTVLAGDRPVIRTCAVHPFPSPTPPATPRPGRA